MTRTGLVVTVGALLLVAACAKPVPGGSPSSGPPSTGSGVAGRTMVDGGCPMVRQGTPCPDKPLSARITVTRVGDPAPLATVTSDSDGWFRIPLAPGRYRLTPANLTGALHPAAGPQDVDVQPDRYTTVTVSFDSGIR
ncbi:MAG TPA: hypothetical protein VF054_11780 [Micromonosporaceae bacterium]